MPYPEAYMEYLVHFHGSRDWFECHEIMEEHWKQESSNERKQQWLALVQIAVGLYHERRGNAAGATKLLSSALTYAASIDWNTLGLDGAVLLRELEERRSFLTDATSGRNEASPYIEWNFPITDQELLRLCMRNCEDKGWIWCATGSKQCKDIADKHVRRDRTEVREARQKAYEAKRKMR